MKTVYSDILNRIPEPPKWWDHDGVPRFDTFTPKLCPDIYSRLVGLFLIECQDCNANMQVEMHATVFDRVNSLPPWKWGYGDPPRHNCPGAGETMSSELRAVLEFWTREGINDWERQPAYEGVVPS